MKSVCFGATGGFAGQAGRLYFRVPATILIGRAQLRGTAFSHVAVGRLGQGFGQEQGPRFGRPGGPSGSEDLGATCKQIGRFRADRRICDSPPKFRGIR